MPVEKLKNAIRDVVDFPVPGIVFKDITPVLSCPELFRSAITLMLASMSHLKVDKIAGIDARGFIFGAAMAHELGVGFVPVRKAGKLPWDCISESYDLEYGTAKLELHKDAIAPGEGVVIVDDLLATGGTAKAVTRLFERLDGRILQINFFAELAFLPGRKALDGYAVNSILQF